MNNNNNNNSSKMNKNDNVKSNNDNFKSNPSKMNNNDNVKSNNDSFKSNPSKAQNLQRIRERLALGKKAKKNLTEVLASPALLSSTSTVKHTPVVTTILKKSVLGQPPQEQSQQAPDVEEADEPSEEDEFVMLDEDETQDDRV